MNFSTFFHLCIYYNLKINVIKCRSSNFQTFYRLYKEDFPKGYNEKKRRKEKEKKKKKKDKKKKKKKKSSKGDIHSASSADEDDEVIQPQWSVACLTLQDWEDLTDKYRKSKKKSERELYETLSESFLPEIVKMFAEKEREERRRLVLMQPKRASSRIERKKQEQEERDRILSEKVSFLYTGWGFEIFLLTHIF